MKKYLNTILFISLIALVAISQERRLGISKNSSGQRVALIIGNSAYADSPLPNPVNDANDMAQILRGLGFEVIHMPNATKLEMKRAIRNFGEMIQNRGVGLFYYAGHAMQINGKNYLLPIGAIINHEYEVEDEAVDLEFLMGQMHYAQNRTNILILDACRNNPFARSFRSYSRGLARVNAPSGTIIAYATSPGEVASDGNKRNSPYTEELLKHIREPGLKIEEVFKRVSIGVWEKTTGKQMPWVESSLLGDFYFMEKNTSSSDSISNGVDKSSTNASPIASKEGANKDMYATIPKLSPANADPGNNLLTYQFDIVALNGDGMPRERYHGQAQYFIEDLGNDVKLEMAWVPGGTFFMGTSDNEINKLTGELRRHLPYDVPGYAHERIKWQTPQHKVTVPSLYMGRIEVTRAQWRAVANLPKVNRELASDPSYFKLSDLQPVEQISWEEAMEFCERLSRATGRNYRLPTEAEWEYACRAGTITQFHFGDTITADLVNFAANFPFDSAPVAEFKTHTAIAGSYNVANQFGLYDMHGNVREWCLDVWHDNYKGAPVNGTAWLTGGKKMERVIRGGSWVNDASYCRSAFRTGNAIDYKNYSIGFRVAISGSRIK
jgi:formylglycine-generating enzyme required for sulfatase activity